LSQRLGGVGPASGERGACAAAELEDSLVWPNPKQLDASGTGPPSITQITRQ